MKPKVTVIDYGVGNLLSVQKALMHCGAEVLFADNEEKILAADLLFLPGVGAFANAMDELNQRNMVGAIKAYCATQKPFLGVCLGMQLMLDQTEEFGVHNGLGLIAGKVEAVPNKTVSGAKQKVPHIGWNEMYRPASSNANSKMLSSLEEKSSVYFVHSYRARPDDTKHVLSVCDYGGHEVAAIIGKDNMYGCQFHPEKSGDIGLSILSSFIRL